MPLTYSGSNGRGKTRSNPPSPHNSLNLNDLDNKAYNLWSTVEQNSDVLYTSQNEYTENTKYSNNSVVEDTENNESIDRGYGNLADDWSNKNKDGRHIVSRYLKSDEEKAADNSILRGIESINDAKGENSSLVENWEEHKQDELNRGYRSLNSGSIAVNGYVKDNDYLQKFDRYTQSMTNSPEQSELNSARKKGFIVGQIKGHDNTTVLNGNVFLRAYSDFISGGSNPWAALDSILNLSSNQALSRHIKNMNFEPGKIRPADPISKQYSLRQILDQNLLRPSDYNNDRLQNTNEGTFKALYTNNKNTGLGGKRTTNNFLLKDGMIAGVGVKALEETEIEQPQFSGSVPTDGRKLHDFEQDNIHYNTDVQDRGFNSNINSKSVYDTPAVIHSEADKYSQVSGRLDVPASVLESYGLTEAQYFPFLFETENRNSSNSSNKQFKQYCLLQAALASMNESYNPNWSGKHYFGRSEEVHTYTHTSRVLDLRFVIFATTGRKLQNVYERIVWLAQQNYGSYSGGASNRLQAGPLIRITIGDLFRRLPGFIRNMSYNWDYMGAGGKWEITKGLRMPQALEVSMSYQVIHDENPNRDTNFYKGLRSGIIDENKPLIKTYGRGKQDTNRETFVDLIARKG